MKKILTLILVLVFSLFCVSDVLAGKQNLTDDNQNKLNKLSELLYDKMSNSSLSFLDDKLKSGIDKFFDSPRFYIKKDNVFFVFDGKLFGANFDGEFQVKVNISELKGLFKKKSKDEGVNLGNYIISEEIGEKKELSKESPKDRKYVALTFDDGPSKTNTPILLDILKENNVKVTFFVLGKNANNFPEIIKQIDEAGHEIGSHSWNHPKLVNLSEEQVRAQVKDTDNVIYNAIGKTPKLFRPPYGEHNKNVDRIIDKTILLWNVDSLDWKTRNVRKNIDIVEKNTIEGSIILMHDIHKTTVDSIDGVIKALKNKGFEFLTVSELLNYYQKEDYSHKVCYSGFNCK